MRSIASDYLLAQGRQERSPVAPASSDIDDRFLELRIEVLHLSPELLKFEADSRSTGRDRTISINRFKDADLPVPIPAKDPNFSHPFGFTRVNSMRKKARSTCPPSNQIQRMHVSNPSVRRVEQPAQCSGVRALREPLQDEFCGCHRAEINRIAPLCGEADHSRLVRIGNGLVAQEKARQWRAKLLIFFRENRLRGLATPDSCDWLERPLKVDGVARRVTTRRTLGRQQMAPDSTGRRRQPSKPE
jgi:hypothetical protein